MNVRCPSCETTYRVDPAKVPAGGMRARCSVCSNLIDVRPAAAESAGATAPAAPVREARRTSAPRRAVPPEPAHAAAPPEPAQPAEPPSPGISPHVTAPAQPTAPPRAPKRPSAPVFRAAPGKPMPAPPVPRPPASPARAAAAPAVPSEKRPTTRPINPFLTQDPRAKARRLARALVSDMIVYQPEKRQQALRAGNLRDAFEEEIKKSWEEYVAQVGEELANSTSYFTEALNEILAGGESMF